MSAHNFGADWHGAGFSQPDPGNGKTIVPLGGMCCVALSYTDTETRTLANPDRPGQVMIISVGVHTSTKSCEVALPVGTFFAGTSNYSIGYESLDHAIILVSVQFGLLYRWAILTEIGVTVGGD